MQLRPMPAGVHTWSDGRLFLKPVGCTPEHAWVCEVYANWTATHVRVPEPVMPHGPGVDWLVVGRLGGPTAHPRP